MAAAKKRVIVVGGGLAGLACSAPFLPDDVYTEVITAAPYGMLTRKDFDDVLAYVELHGSDTGQAAALTLARAAAWMRQHGCGATEAVMSDNAFAYTHSRAFQAVLEDLGARHIRIPPYTPRWNGKVERFIQTLDTEWAHSRVWASSAQRDRALSSFLRYYNRRRPHSSLNDRPPISRVHNVPRQDT